MLRLLVGLCRDALRYRRFPRTYSAFRGVYPDFDTAARAAPTVKPLGYNNAALAEEYVRTLSTSVESYDYPMIFHLGNMAEKVRSVFDFGGNVGTHLYAYSRYVDLAPDLTWTVCEVPAIARAGRRLADRRNEDRLAFTTVGDHASGVDVFLSSGAIQYFDHPSFADFLDGLPEKPAHLLLNRMPLHDGPEFVTLQNGGMTFYPQRVLNHGRFVSELGRIGYELVDTWKDHVDRCIIPFHAGRSLAHYFGMYLRLG